MKPADQILAETQELEAQITKLIRDFEDRTGAYVSRIEVAEFLQGSVREHGKQLRLFVIVGLPPLLSTHLRKAHGES